MSSDISKSILLMIDFNLYSIHVVFSILNKAISYYIKYYIHKLLLNGCTNKSLNFAQFLSTFGTIAE